MAKRLKELIVDNENCLREKSGKKVDVTPVGYPMGFKIPYDPNFDKRNVTAMKNFLILHQSQCQNLPGISNKGRYSPKGFSIDYYLVNQDGQIIGTSDFNMDFNARRVADFDVQGREITQYEKEETRHHFEAVQFYRRR